MSIWHNPEREQLRKTVRAFAEREVLPNVEEWERTCDLPRELPAEAAAAIGHRLLGAAFAIRRARGRGRWYAKDPGHARMPVVLDPSLTTRQVRQQATALLPGAQVRRLLFWRYLLVWQKPLET